MNKLHFFLVFVLSFGISSNAQFVQNFDSGTSTPSGWSVINGGDTNTWQISVPLAGTGHSGANVVQIATSTVAHDDYFVSPTINVITGVNDRFSFWVRSLYSAYSEHFEVKLSTTGATADSFTTTLIPDSAGNPNWTKYTVDLSPFAGQNVYVGIHAISANQYALILDDFVNDALPQLPPFPQDFDLSNSLPNQWSILNTSGTYAWSFPTITTSLGAITGTNSAMMKIIQNVTQNDYLVTAPITVVAGVNDRLNYKKRSSSYPYSINIRVSTTNNSSLASFTNIIYDSYIYDSEHLDLSAYVGQTIYIALNSSSSNAGYILLDNFYLDRMIPDINSDCNGYFDLTLQTPIILNGLNAIDNIVSYYTDSYSANLGSNPISPTDFSFSSSNNLFVVYARIYNTQTNTFSITHFNALSKRISFDFNVTDYSIQSSITNSSSSGTKQWYKDGIPIPNENNNILNINLVDYSNYHIEYTNNLGCTAISESIPFFHLNQDTFIVNLSNGVTADTPSIMQNDSFAYPSGSYVSCTFINNSSGITISQDGIISVETSVPPGTYHLNCSVYLNTSYNISYNLEQDVTIIVPVNGIKMNAFIDTNNNGVKDFGEANFPKGKFKYIINNNGINNVIISPVGSCTIYDTEFTNSYNLNYEIDYEFNTNYSFSNISFNNVTITGTGIQEYNFPITVTNNYNDLSIALIPQGNPIPGFSYKNRISYSNNGTQTIPFGTISFTNGNGISITSVSEASITSNANGFGFNFSNLLPFETRHIDVQFLVSTIPAVSLGQQVTNSASITLASNDVLPLNNSATLNQTIIGSYDPNQKSESYGPQVLYSEFNTDNYLTYTIEFENTGTFYARNIRVNDILDSRLDENSVRMIDASHLYTLNRVGSNLNWNFDNIYLQPSVVGTNIGKGFVTFKIKPKSGYAVGDIIPNTANIYFDFNPAIVTNTCTTEFVTVLTNQNFAFNEFQFSPNPVINSLTISNSNRIDEVEITSLLGQKMIVKKVNNLQTEISFSDFSNGVYFVKIISNGQEKIIKIIKQR